MLFRSLLSNAVKYTPEGGTIWFRLIGLKQRSSQYEHIRIEVEDTGYGMTPEYLETIFDAFTRAENSTTNKVQGTGLGMAITKNIVELMGGTIEVTSEVDQGSLFRVELEFRIPEDQVDQYFWSSRGISHVLAVASDETLCQSIQTLMRETSVEVDSVHSIQDALALLQEDSTRYHVLLADWALLHPAGLPAAEQLRAALPESIPLLLLADYDADDTEAFLSLPNTSLLFKPFFVSAFKEKITELREHPMGTIDENGADQDSLEGLHFLAAEDNEINAEILSEILEIEGASCEIVENGQLAVERFQASSEGEFDAILMDVQMPVMNGHEATRAIRRLPRSDAAKIPILAMTANAFAEDEKAALDAGMDAHVAKPIDVALLKKVIRHYIERKEGIV